LIIVDFKYGAFYPHVPVQPIAIKYKYEYYNPCFVTDNLVVYALKTAMQFKNELELVFLPVVEPETEEEKTDVKVWTEKNYKVCNYYNINIIIINNNKKKKKKKKKIGVFYTYIYCLC